MQWCSHMGGQGGRVPPLTAKKFAIIQEKIRKKEEKLGKGKNWKGSFTLPLLTDRAGYATGEIRITKMGNAKCGISLCVCVCLAHCFFLFFSPFFSVTTKKKSKIGRDL